MIKFPPFLFAFVSCGLASARAGSLSTLSQFAAGQDVVSYNTWQAQSFSLGSTAGSYRVRRVTLHMQQVVANASLVLRITGSLGTMPNLADVRAVLTIPAPLPASPQKVAFSAAASPDPLLLPGQSYWLVLGVTSLDDEQPLPAGVFRWSYAPAAGADAPSAAGWTLGSATATSGTGGSGWSTAQNTPYLFSIDARPPVYAAPVLPYMLSSGGTPVAAAHGTPGVEYDVEVSASLSSWTLGGTAFADAAGLIRFPDPAGPARRFYRFR